ncbi:class I SAM-dependent methyltransferase [Oleispirillum naphthae]|uniref:class I SAM-dependent methyltransferase n=1 Tax=Oleispirillum naphthae TaxID=2838853 RepID=UPI00308259EF
MADLLLHSLAEFTPFILSLLDAAEARNTVEIGVEYGLISPTLIERARREGGVHTGIDPAPQPGADALFEGGHARLAAAPSLEALPGLPPSDAYLVDGDHNYYTVLSELRLIRDAAAAAGRGFPLVILHDIGWPCARRDLYYAPQRIPPEFRMPHSFSLGMRPGKPLAGKGGFRGEGVFACALNEGGPRNGVLTALEDFLEETPGLHLSCIAAVFGLGVLATEEMAERLEPLISPLRDNPLLAKMERNRLDLYIRVLDWQDGILAR